MFEENRRLHVSHRGPCATTDGEDVTYTVIAEIFAPVAECLLF